jgi:hypothetical protein
MAIFSSLILISMTATQAFGQRGCELSVVGAWKAADANESNPIHYRFSADGTVSIMSGPGFELKEIATATYVLDNPKAPKTILVKTAKAVGGFAEGTTPIDVTAYDDTSITFTKPGSGPTRWVRVDPHRYFMALAGRIKTFYDGGGPTFPMLIKTDGRETRIDAVGLYAAKDAVGIYSANGHWAFGPIPPEVYNHFMKEPTSDSEVLLRLEITGVQYERALKVVKTWERRVRQADLLYPDLDMNNILVAKQVTESLNQCGEKFSLYKLDWSLKDHISHAPLDNPVISRIPFFYYKELRRLNESRHVPDEKFHQVVGVMKGSAGQ